MTFAPNPKRNQVIQLFLQNCSFGLIARQLKLTRNQVAGIINRYKKRNKMPMDDITAKYNLIGKR